MLPAFLFEGLVDISRAMSGLGFRFDVDYLGIWNEKASDSNFARVPVAMFEHFM